MSGESSRKSSLSSHRSTGILPKPKVIPEFKNFCIEFNELPFPNEQEINSEYPEIMKGTNLIQLAKWFVILKFQAYTLLEERNSLKEKFAELEQKMNELSNKPKPDTTNTLDKILRKVDSVETKLKFLASGKGEIISDKPTYSEVAKLKDPTRAENVLIMRQAIFEEKQRPIYENSIVLSNVPNDCAKSMVDTLCNLSSIPSTSAKSKFINNKQQNQNSKNMIIRFDSKEHAQKVKKNFLAFKKTDNLKFGKISMRPYYSKSEMEIFQKLWSEAKELNNAANSYIWTVRNLRLTKLSEPKTWINKEKRFNLEQLFTK